MSGESEKLNLLNLDKQIEALKHGTSDKTDAAKLNLVGLSQPEKPKEQPAPKQEAPKPAEPKKDDGGVLNTGFHFFKGMKDDAVGMVNAGLGMFANADLN